MTKPAEGQIVLFLPHSGRGGAERVFVNLAAEFEQEGLDIALLLGTREGVGYLEELPPTLDVSELGRQHMRHALPAMVRYLRRKRPAVLVSALDHANLMTILAAKLARTGTRVVATIHNNISPVWQGNRSLHQRLVIRCMLKVLPWAQEIVAVSSGLADDVARLAKIPRDRVRVIYNPIISPALRRAALEPTGHPWFQEGQLPVVLGAGRLAAEKDFPNLIRAFAIARKTCQARLVILGEGEERPALERLVQSLGLEDDVGLPGVVANPFAYMSRSALFVLSSAWEAFGNVLVEALACGCPVVSTDCPSGPREILQGGRLGKLVPVGDETALAEAILAGLRGECATPATEADLAPFSVAAAAEAYLRLMFGDASQGGRAARTDTP
jgi:glycosyltransferase involved in cell wall biosynthesis